MKTRRVELIHSLERQGVTDPEVIRALLAVPREEFVPLETRGQAYANIPLAIGEEQTISQPLIVGLMSQLLMVRRGDKVLEIGTGSGYQTAVLLELGADVYSLERLEGLATLARQTLGRLGYNISHLKVGSGFDGWPEAAPFDRIIVTAAPEVVPAALLNQLNEPGRMVIPVGPRQNQKLFLITKENGRVVTEPKLAVSFVPMR